jgi:hypothetical protein
MDPLSTNKRFLEGLKKEKADLEVKKAALTKQIKDIDSRLRGIDAHMTETSATINKLESDEHVGSASKEGETPAGQFGIEPPPPPPANEKKGWLWGGKRTKNKRRRSKRKRLH